jgi:ATP-dependent RNA helicase DeaD
LVRPEERRKLDYLKQAAKKATKAQMSEGKPPAIETVIAAKTRALVRDLSTGSSGTTEPVADSIVKLAGELSTTLGAQEALCRVLERAYGDALNEHRYGVITEYTDRKPRQSSGPREMQQGSYGRKSSYRETPVRSDSNQIRLYVGLGRRDGFGARETAQFFSDLLHIPQRLVDRIEVTENFSLVSLPYQAGMDALGKSKRDKSLPHIHVDVKEDAREGSAANYKRRKRA